MCVTKSGFCYNAAVIIDFHTHIVPSRFQQNRDDYAKKDPGFKALYSDPKSQLATAEQLIAAMDRDGIDVSVVLNYAWQTTALICEVNDYILEAVAKYPKRLIGFCMAPLIDNDIALREIERCVAGGARGLGEIRPDIQIERFGIFRLEPVVDYLMEHDLILLTHASEPVGHHYPGKGSATPDLLFEFILAYPELKIVCAHWGGGLLFYANMPEVKDALKNTWFDSAASPFLYKPDIYRHVTEIAGADKVLFGTDYPLIPAQRYFDEIDTIYLPDGVKRGILGENARRLLGL
jgi:uncharacterized protein